MWAKSLLLSASLAVSAVGSGAVDASPRAPVQAQAFIQVQNRGQDIRPLREVVDTLRARYGGELISARLEQGSRPIYVLRWRLPSGEVRDFRVDAAR